MSESNMMGHLSNKWNEKWYIWNPALMNKNCVLYAYYGLCCFPRWWCCVEKIDKKNRTIKVTEIRKVVNVEWANKQRPSQHVLVTQLVGCEAQETLEPYCIDETFFKWLKIVQVIIMHAGT